MCSSSERTRSSRALPVQVEGQRLFACYCSSQGDTERLSRTDTPSSRASTLAASVGSFVSTSSQLHDVLEGHHIGGGRIGLMHISRPALRRSQVSDAVWRGALHGFGRLHAAHSSRGRPACSVQWLASSSGIGNRGECCWNYCAEIIAPSARRGTKSRGGCEVFVSSGDRVGWPDRYLHIHSHLPNGSAESQVAGGSRSWRVAC